MPARGSGVMFTLDPDTGFPDVVLVNGAFGLGEAVVQGQLDPDEFLIFKPTLRSGHRALLKKKIVRKTWKLMAGTRGMPERAEIPLDAQLTPSLTDAEVAGARSLRRGDRAALLEGGVAPGAHGHRMGQGRRRWPALHPPGATGDGAPGRAASGHRGLLLAPDAARERSSAVWPSASASERARHATSRAPVTSLRSGRARCSWRP